MTDRTLAPYLGWLASQVTPNRRRNFDELFEQMFAKEFVFVIANDNNRIQDARELRHDYFREQRIKPYVDVDILGPISVLEVMIGLSRRASFMTDDPPGEWAWQLLCNLGLDRYSGRISRRWANEIDEILDILIWRQYSEAGQGGFFPLAWPQQDQRDVELWWQLSAYLAEQEDPHDVPGA